MHNHSQDNRKTERSVLKRLPLVITNISVQKKNRDRFSLFHQSEFLIGVSGKTLNDFSLQKGVVLTPSLFRKLEQAEEYHTLKKKCLRYLGRRDHAAFELKQKLGEKGFSEASIDHVIEELASKKLINDKEFALKFAADKTEFKKWGPRKIEAALFKKGLPKPLIDNAIKKAAENLPQHQICVDLALKRSRHFLREDDPYKRKQKIYNYLAGRGFSGSAIKKSLPKITAKLDA
jgi:regulatory protein